jgi:hypothetical protein
VSQVEPRSDQSGPAESAHPPPRPWPRLVLLVVGFAVAGVLAGVLWEAFWSPPSGFVVEEVWHLDNEGVQKDFSGTGLYVLVALPTGILMGVVSAVTARTHEVATLVAVVVGSSIAAALMSVTGHALGPPDPRPLAGGEEDLTAIPSDLRVVGTTPYAALPAGALTGLAVCFVGLHGSRRNQD